MLGALAFSSLRSRVLGLSGLRVRDPSASHSRVAMPVSKAGAKQRGHTERKSERSSTLGRVSQESAFRRTRRRSRPSSFEDDSSNGYARKPVCCRNLTDRVGPQIRSCTRPQKGGLTRVNGGLALVDCLAQKAGPCAGAKGPLETRGKAFARWLMGRDSGTVTSTPFGGSPIEQSVCESCAPRGQRRRMHAKGLGQV